MNACVLQEIKERVLNSTSGSVQGIENRTAIEGEVQRKLSH